jgi:uncharacterized membrane protein
MNAHTEPSGSEALPFAAPCRTLATTAPLGWLRRGAADFRRAWPQSLAYGALMALAMAAVSALAWRYGQYWFMLAMLGGFVFIAPLACTGLYVLSAQLERGQRPSMRAALATAFKQLISTELVFTLVLLIVFLVWARAGAMVSVFFPVHGRPSFEDYALYLSIGTLVGAVFATITFAVSAFSLPMILHRRVDAVTAAVTSVNAVLRNKRAMAVWLALIVAGILIGAATAFVGLAVILPIIGHGAWHGYLETIDASAFPRHEAGVTALPRSPRASR